jgi:hypothetical protein
MEVYGRSGNLTEEDADRITRERGQQKMEAYSMATQRRRFGPTRPPQSSVRSDIELMQRVIHAAKRYNNRPYGVENGTLRTALDIAILEYEERSKGNVTP